MTARVTELQVISKADFEISARPSKVCHRDDITMSYKLLRAGSITYYVDSSNSTLREVFMNILSMKKLQ